LFWNKEPFVGEGTKLLIPLVKAIF